ncbi:hypothetical protein HYE60_11800 [Aggregatibacter actinomycetemcomitans]|uniref:hypothetical protein n=1 Tax=Aggregatibacter actinomycetemcomitans TaxID=714 RepID=UPI00197C5093|nr:hypothetical protein [Aggregatibacter actinomycetemcomitans]MBN6075908.1 hypothetical protein [Aggregatibacter actinomycetemcomitans]
MTEIKLQNSEMQEKLTALLGEFDTQKAALISLNSELKELEGKQVKNNATLSAVKGEFESELAGIKAKFEQSHELTIDDYTETQKLKAEFKSRIEFFNAIDEELEEKIYLKREQIFTAHKRLDEMRKQLFMFYGEALIDEFIQQHQEQIKLFKTLIVTYADYNEKTGKKDESKFNKLLTEKLAKFDIEVPAEFTLPVPALPTDWKPKSPMQKHTDGFLPQQEKGFKRLLNNI